MKPERFISDLERKPETLLALADRLQEANPWAGLDLDPHRRLVLVGMGSSNYAGEVAAERLRAHGVNAIASLSSSDVPPLVGEQDLAVIISASGTSKETVAAAQYFADRCRTIGMTNTPDSPVEALTDHHLAMHADVEESGVACRSFQHTLALLLALDEHLHRFLAESSEPMYAPRTATLARQAARATEDLLGREDQWRPAVSERILGPDGTAFVAPQGRICSARQSALMLRETPRLPAIACETGDWSHVDVYLTKTTDYRMLLFAGSPHEPELLEWCQQRGSTVVAVGADLPTTQMSVRYVHDDISDVRLLSEVLIAELVAARAYQRTDSQ
jgi:fructoselysine-6-P-deglycase FrlB-like protein